MTVLKLRQTRKESPLIKQSRIKRDWMDTTYNKHAYQCLPMTMANVYGWELCLKETIKVSWEGGNHNVKVNPENSQWASGGIIGIVSFNLGWRFKTEPGYSLWIGGSPNLIVPGAHALSAIIPSSWWPDEFQMNWVITEIGKDVEFTEGFPFMYFCVIEDSLLPRTILQIDDSPESIEFIQSRVDYGREKMRKNTEEPWTWTKGIKTGVDAGGNIIGPTFTGLPKLAEPNSKINFKKSE